MVEFGFNGSFVRNLDHFVLSTVLSAGITSAIVGLLGKRWLASVGANQARELEILRARYSSELEHSQRLLQSEIDKTFLVTKVHFETEFQAVKEVFSILAEIRLDLPNLRPTSRIAPVGETREERLVEFRTLFNKLNVLRNRLLSVSENLAPFYPKEIYCQIEVCCQILGSEWTDIQLTKDEDHFTPDWYRKGAENLQKFLEAYDKVSGSIRKRIEHLGILRSV